MSSFSVPAYSLIRDEIKQGIISGIWPLGQHITIAELCKHFSVSANPIREALLQLQGEGIIDMRMNRGALVPVVDESYVHNVCRLRSAIQAMLASEAAISATPEQVDQLKLLVDEHAAAAKSCDTAATVKANRTFHHYVDSIAKNPQALDVLASRTSLLDAYRRAIGYEHSRLDRVVVQHRKLVYAISRGDPEKAAAASREHTETARIDLISAIKKKAKQA